jgi:hypothetical protein
MIRTGFTFGGCDCDGENDHGYDAFDYEWYRIPKTFGALLGFVFFLLSCCIECKHWRSYWKWRRHEMVVTPAPPVPSQTDNPLAAVSAHADAAEDAPSPWRLTAEHNQLRAAESLFVCSAIPCCMQAFTLWGVPSPVPTLQALRQQHDARKLRTSPDVAAVQSPQPGEAPAVPEPIPFFEPTFAGTKAWGQAVVHAHKEKTCDRVWARAGCGLCSAWVNLHPTAAAILCFLLSCWFAHGENILWWNLGSWLLYRSFGPCFAICFCRPMGCCNFTRACKPLNGKRPCAWVCPCIGAHCGHWLLVIPMLIVIILAQQDCSATCALTGWGIPGLTDNKMTAPMRTLYSAEYYGRK